ncbi:MAG TPA: phosphopantetheine-binding protein [Anaeromyxobacteraceae bacterium]|nr:phosphopantetheine-binding protein [Anaeromyxobacteraceae bacterium]
MSPALRHLARLLWLRACDEVGEGVTLEGRPSIENAGRLVLGARVHLSSSPVQSHLVVARGGALILGDDVHLAHGAAIAAHRSIRIGAGARIGPFAVISDTDFHVAGAPEVRAEGAAVVIGRAVRLGSRVTILRGSSIGDGARVAAGSVVSGDVAAGAAVAGVPARPAPAGASALAQGETLAAQVPRVVAAALGLKASPGPGDGPRELPEWDSLGALRVLLALEEELGITLDESAAMRARDLSELTALVEAAEVRRSAG